MEASSAKHAERTDHRVTEARELLSSMVPNHTHVQILAQFLPLMRSLEPILQGKSEQPQLAIGPHHKCLQRDTDPSDLTIMGTQMTWRSKSEATKSGYRECKSIKPRIGSTLQNEQFTILAHCSYLVQFQQFSATHRSTERLFGHS